MINKIINLNYLLLVLSFVFLIVGLLNRDTTLGAIFYSLLLATVVLFEIKTIAGMSVKGKVIGFFTILLNVVIWFIFSWLTFPTGVVF